MFLLTLEKLKKSISFIAHKQTNATNSSWDEKYDKCLRLHIYYGLRCRCCCVYSCLAMTTVLCALCRWTIQISNAVDGASCLFQMFFYIILCCFFHRHNFHFHQKWSVGWVRWNLKLDRAFWRHHDRDPHSAEYQIMNENNEELQILFQLIKYVDVTFISEH